VTKRSVHGRWALLAALVLALSACGGDDDESATSPATASETATAAGNERLEPDAWAEYVETRDEARAVNEKAIATFRRCRDLLGTEVEAQRVFDCLGTAAEDVVTEGRAVLAVLDGFAEDVSGSCATATSTLHGNVKLYIATVNQIAISVDRSTLPENQVIESALELLAGTRAASARFEDVCKPV
jgi:hypothetical protein